MPGHRAGVPNRRRRCACAGRALAQAWDRLPDRGSRGEAPRGPRRRSS